VLSGISCGQTLTGHVSAICTGRPLQQASTAIRGAPALRRARLAAHLPPLFEMPSPQRSCSSAVRKPSPADEATVNEMLQRAITSPEPTGRYVARVLHGAHAGAVDASISVPAARPAAARTVLDETAMCSPYIVQGPSFCQRLVHFVDRRHLYCTYMRACSGMRPNGCPVSIPRQLVVNQSTVAHGHLPDPMSGLSRSAPPLSLSP